MFIKISSNNLAKGNVLLSTILIMGLALNIGLVIAVLSLNGMGRINNLKSQALSYYAAETGAETSLYKVRKSGEEVENLNTDITNPDIGIGWQTKGQIKTNVIQEDLEEDRSIVLYLYNPETWASGIKTLNITWQDTCHNKSALEISRIYPINSQTQFDNLDWNNASEVTEFYRNDPFIVSNNGIVSFSLFETAAYAIKITAKYCYVNYLAISAKGFTASGEEVDKDINMENIITSTGSIGDVKQTIRVSM